MVILDVPQLSEEWFAARAGLPTASNFDKIVTSKGEPSKQSKKYMYQLAGERVTGIKEETYQNAAMQRGMELEGEAKDLYSLVRGVSVENVGLCYPDDKKLVGASLDGLVGNDGGVEIKCATLPVAVEYLLNNKMPVAYIQQVQGQLYVTGRKWIDFVSYYPGLKPLIVRVDRDKGFISALEHELKAFCAELEILVKRIK